MEKKNILFIFTDQHRADSLSCYNKDTLCKTPNIDSITKNSVVFNNAYTTCPVCTPARSSVHTGLYPSKTGMEANSFETGARTHEIMDNPNLLSRRLQTVDYKLGYTGKWHLGVGKDKTETVEGRSLLSIQNKGFMESGAYTNYGTLPTDLGFVGDDFPGHGNGGWHYPQFKKYLENNNLKLEIINTEGNLLPGDHSITGEIISPIETTIEHYLVERTINIIDECIKEDKPFFFNLNFWGPHSPFYAPTKYLDMYRNIEIPQWPSFNKDISTEPRIYGLLRRPELDWDFFQNTLRHYYACISHIDNQIGRLINYLKEKGIYDNTVIIFSADHGDNQGCHGKMENKSYSMYDDTTNIPLFIKPAIKDYDGYTQSAFAGTCDIYATILDLAGYVPNDEYGFGDGRSLAPFISEKNITDWSDEIVSTGMGAFPIVTTQRMYRKGKYKYVFNGAGEDQLFDMEKDKYEMNNLVLDPQYKEILYDIKNSFADWMDRNGDIIRDSFCKINRIKEWN